MINFVYLAWMGGRPLVSKYTNIANIERETTNFNHIFSLKRHVAEIWFDVLYM